MRNWSDGGVEFSGIWLDMNEPSSFCTGSWYAHSSATNLLICTRFLVAEQAPTSMIPVFPLSIFPVLQEILSLIIQNGKLTFRSPCTILIWPNHSYNPEISGPSGNLTVNGKLTCTNSSALTSLPSLPRRGLWVGQEPQVNLNTPPYAIHDGTVFRSYPE